jgi:hypothetical protein
MNELKISPCDLMHLEQYKKYATSLKYPANKMQWKYSSINKYPMEALIAYNNLDVYNTVTVLYKITNFESDSNNNVVIYNTTFLSVNPKNRSNLYINQMCPSGSILSKNSEYRSGLINWQNFTRFLKNNKSINELFETIMMYITEMFHERKNKLTVEFFYPSGKKYSNKKEIEADCSKNMIQFYAITWIKFYYDLILNVISNNLNNDFKQIMLKYQIEDKKTFIKILSEYKVEFEILIYICNNSINEKINLYENKKLGEKMTILNLAEYTNSFNIEYSAWCELSINSKVSNIVLNKITNGFSLLNNWTFIYADNISELFDNLEHSDKIKKSKIAVKITDLLTQAQKYAKPSTVKFNKNINSILKNITDSYDSINSREIDTMNVLKNNIKRSINYAKENIILSNVVLNMISEHSGQTFYDNTFLTGYMFDSSNYNNFKKYMFQLLYNLYCLNTKIHCIHGDLHLNNITISPMFNKAVKIDIKNPQILYILEDSYQFNNNFLNLCIIDFNTSIINPDLYDPTEFTNINSIDFNKDNLLKIQIKKILTYLFSIKPIYKQYENIITNNMTFHFNEYFKILSALDLYNVSCKLLTFIKIKKVGNVCDSSRDMINSVNKLSDYYLTTVFEKLLNTKIYTEFENMEWPAVTIIKKLFPLEIINPDMVTDIYNYTNLNKFTLTSSKDFPNYLQKNN